jgi:hypothetical protein
MIKDKLGDYASYFYDLKIEIYIKDIFLVIQNSINNKAKEIKAKQESEYLERKAKQEYETINHFKQLSSK